MGEGELGEDENGDTGTLIVEWLRRKSKVGMRIEEGWIQSSKLCDLIWNWG